MNSNEFPEPGTEAKKHGEKVDDSEAELSDEQKRLLRAVRRGYRVASVEIKDNGWMLEVVYLDGSKVNVNSKMLKLKAAQLIGG